MGKKVGINEASEITGLSRIELRKGAKLGKYPHYRVGGPRGKIIFDLELLNNQIEVLMLNNILKKESPINSSIRMVR